MLDAFSFTLPFPIPSFPLYLPISQSLPLSATTSLLPYSFTPPLSLPFSPSTAPSVLPCLLPPPHSSLFPLLLTITGELNGHVIDDVT